MATPEQQAAIVAAVLKKNAQAQAAARVAAVELCLKFRQLMAQDPEVAMEQCALIAAHLAQVARTYTLLKQQARTFDALIGV